MATKFYLEYNNVYNSYGATLRGTWNNTLATAPWYLKTTGQNIYSSSTKTSASLAETSGSAYNAALMKFVSLPLAAQTILSGTTFTLRIAGVEDAGNMNAYIQASVAVTSDANGALRFVIDGTGGTELPSGSPTTPGDFTGRVVTLTVSGDQTVTAGDRLLLEVGYRATNTKTTSWTGAVASGYDSADSDFSTESQTDYNAYNAYLECSQTLVFTKPSVTLDTTDGQSYTDAIPLVKFTGSVVGGGDIRYQLQIATENTFASPIIDVTSNDRGFVNAVTPGDGDPYGTLAQITYVPQDIDEYHSSNVVSGQNLIMHTATQSGGGQAFTGDGSVISGVGFTCGKVSLTYGTIYVRLYAATGTIGTDARPTGSPLAEYSVGYASFPTSGWNIFRFATPYQTTPGVNYCAVIEYSEGQNSGTYVYITRDSDAPAHYGNYCVKQSGVWVGANTHDCNFAIYKHLQDGTYYWRVRGICVTGSNEWGDWATYRYFTVSDTVKILDVYGATHGQTADSFALTNSFNDDEFNDQSTAGFWHWVAGTGGTHSENASGQHQIYSGQGDTLPTVSGCDFTYLYQGGIVGDFDVYTKVTTSGYTADYHMTGLVARVSTYEYATAYRIYGDPYIRFLLAAGESTWNTTDNTGLTGYSTYWLRLQRVGTNFRGYVAVSDPDAGGSWTQLTDPGGTDLVSSAPVEIGIFANAASTDQFTAYFDFVKTWSTHKTLTVNECRSTHTADSPQPSTSGGGDTSLTVNECRNLHAVDSPALTQAHTLVVDEARSTHTADSFSVTVGGVGFQSDEFNDQSTAGFWTWDAGTSGTHSENASGQHQIYSGTGDVLASASLCDFTSLHQAGCSGDFDIYTKVTASGYVSDYYMMGLMARVSTYQYVIIYRIYSEPYLRFLHASGEDAWDYEETSSLGTGENPIWLRLKRVGSNFTAYYATSDPTSGGNWTEVSGPTGPFTSSADVDLGIFANAASSFQFTAYFDFLKTWTAATNLTVNECRSTHTADSPAPTQVHSLNVNEARSLHASDSFALTRNIILTINECRHLHAGDSFALTEHKTLTVNEARSLHASDPFALTEHKTLTVNEARNLHASDPIVLAQAHTLVVDECRQLHTGDSFALLAAGTLGVDEALHAHAADSPVLSQVHTLAVDECRSLHTADSPVLAQVHTLGVNEALHGHIGDSFALSISGTQLEVDACLHAHTAAGVSNFGPFYSWGHATPDLDETVNPWSLWKYTNGTTVSTQGDAYGGMLPGGQACLGPVVDLGDASGKAFTAERDKYDTGSGSVTIYIRGSADSFAWDAASPSWVTLPVSGNWRYVQLKME